MKYALLIYRNEKEGLGASGEEGEALRSKFLANIDTMRGAEVLLGGDELHPTATATTVRVQNGKRVTTHGPFAETIEQLGGFITLEVKNLDEALEWAAQIAAATVSSVEVRPVVDLGQRQ
jgi:hypothetical protein